MSTLREAFQKVAVCPEEIINIEGVGDVLMIGLTVPEVSELLLEKPQGKDETEIQHKQGARFIIKCAHDPKTRERIFDVAHEEMLLKLPAMMFYDLRNEAQKLCGLRGKEEIKKS